jgi:hypothetical protein
MSNLSILLVDGVTLFDVLVGNTITRFGPLQSHADGESHRYHYTTGSGSRVTLQWWSWKGLRGKGRRQAAVTWADLAERHGWPAHVMATGGEWEVALTTAPSD